VLQKDTLVQKLDYITTDTPAGNASLHNIDELLMCTNTDTSIIHESSSLWC